MNSSRAVIPQCRSSGAILGSRPRKATNNSIGSFEPPASSTSVLKSAPVAALKMPSSSKREKASADNTSAHL